MAFAVDSDQLVYRQAHETLRRKLYQLRQQLPLTESAMAVTHIGMSGRQRLRDTMRLALEVATAGDEYFEEPTNFLYQSVFEWKQACFEADYNTRLDVADAYKDFQRWSSDRDIIGCSCDRFTELLAEEGGVRVRRDREGGRYFVQGRLKPEPEPPFEITEATAPELEVEPAKRRRGRPPKLPGEGPSRRQNGKFRKAEAVTV